jgi:SAM-dependent methyltransferase
MLAKVKGLLGYVPLYVALQRGLGADKLRYRCLDELDLRAGETVLDIGCGPAYYFERLISRRGSLGSEDPRRGSLGSEDPRRGSLGSEDPGIRYVGFDTAPRYIDYARKRWGDRAEFRCAVFTEEQLATLPPADAVLMLGLLHHLSDQESRDLLALVARALAPGGRVISVDTCYEPSQGRISRWMSDNDRGEFVREPAGFTALAQAEFDDVAGELITDVTRIPSSFWMMRMAAPIAARNAGQRSS